MDDECPFCKERALSWEDFSNFHGDCAGSRVCTSCGGVVDENHLTTDEGPRDAGQCVTNSYVPATPKERQLYNVRCGAPSVSKGRRIGLDLTKRISRSMDCKPTMTTEALHLFERIIDHPHFRLRRLIAKRAIAACSVYIVCRLHDWPVMLGDVCGITGCTIYAIESWKKRILITFPELGDIRAPDLFELLEARCKKAALSNEVEQTAIAIIKLCRDLWLTEGRKQDNIIIPALFIAWQSDEPALRLKVKLRNFCRHHQLSSVTTHSQSSLSNMRATLCGLAVKIPWVTCTSLTDANIALYVKDIVKYRSTLIAEARSDILRMQQTCDDCIGPTEADNPDSDATYKSSASRPTVETHCSGAKETCCETACAVEIETVNCINSYDSHTATSTSQNKATVCSRSPTRRHAVTREQRDYYEMFWPPVGYNAYKRIRDEEQCSKMSHLHNLDCVDLTAHDIPDDEMHLYIKSV